VTAPPEPKKRPQVARQRDRGQTRNEQEAVTLGMFPAVVKWATRWPLWLGIVWKRSRRS